MTEGFDVENLLQNGFWTSSRVKPRNPTRSSFQSTTTPPPPYSETTPRTTFPSTGKVTQSSSRANRPPRPTVEDEAEAVAREYGSVVSSVPDEEPQVRGDIDQYPIIDNLDSGDDSAVDNPERRFVLVSQPSPDISENPPPPSEEVRVEGIRDGEAKSAPKPPRGETSRRTTVSTPQDGNLNIRLEPEHRPVNVRRRSRHQDLPNLVTNLHPDVGSKPADPRRAKSAMGTERQAEDYFSPRVNSARVPADTLTPDVIKHSTKGRDRAYWDFNSPANRGTPTEKRSGDQHMARPTQASGPALNKRHSAIEVPQGTRQRSKDSVDKVRTHSEAPPPHLNRKGSSNRTQGEHGPVVSRRTSGYKSSRSSPSYDDGSRSSEEDNRRRREQEEERERQERRNRRKSFINDDKPSKDIRSSERKPKGPSPMPSPRASQHDIRQPSPTPRSATFPSEHKRSDTRTSIKEDRPERPSSRGSTTSSIGRSATLGAAAALAAVAPTAATGNTTPHERPRSQVLPPLEKRSAGSIPGTPRSDLEPPKYRPEMVGSRLNYRPADSESGNQQTWNPNCPRTRPQVGLADWFVLPGSNMHICPFCYREMFSKTNFSRDFKISIPPLDKPIACDFGSNAWYRMAWCLTSIYEVPDLRLLQGISSVTARETPCGGNRESRRAWLSLQDPGTQRPIQDFSICKCCAKSIGVLLPNLAKAFIPLDPPPRTSWGICSMYYEPDRLRFVHYWDLMERASFDAANRNVEPDLQSLANEVRKLSLVNECTRGEEVHDGKWYTTKTIPELTVCEECFDAVVWPDIENESDVAAAFLKRPVRLPVATCQLYSRRMREVYAKASQEKDLQYLAIKVRERRRKEVDIPERIDKLQRSSLDPMIKSQEVKKLVDEWKKVE